MNAITSLPATATASDPAQAGRGYSDLGQAEFFRLLTVQMQQQDPFEPVDNTQMLAQMAQFSSLAGLEDMNTSLKEISKKLDTLADAQATVTKQENAA